LQSEDYFLKDFQRNLVSNIPRYAKQTQIPGDTSCTAIREFPAKNRFPDYLLKNKKGYRSSEWFPFWGDNDKVHYYYNMIMHCILFIKVKYRLLLLSIKKFYHHHHHHYYYITK